MNIMEMFNAMGGSVRLPRLPVERRGGSDLTGGPKLKSERLRKVAASCPPKQYRNAAKATR